MSKASQQLMEHFFRLVARRQLAHAYAFTGEDTKAKEEVTLALIQALACPQFEQANRPDQTCNVCQRAAGNALSDVLYVQADGKYIRVDQIRQMREWLATSPVELNMKVAVIEEAWLMNEAASNALLKFLEEPVENAYIILYTPVMSILLPTIQSRVQSFHLPTDSTNREALIRSDKAFDEHALQILMNLPQGASERLQEQYEAEELNAWLDAWKSYYALLVQGKGTAFVSVQAHLKPYLSVQGSLDGLDYLLLLNRSTMFARMDFPKDSRQIQNYFVENLCANAQPTLEHLSRLNDTIYQAKEKIQANVSPQLALEQLALKASFR